MRIIPKLIKWFNGSKQKMIYKHIGRTATLFWKLSQDFCLSRSHNLVLSHISPNSSSQHLFYASIKFYFILYIKKVFKLSTLKLTQVYCFTNFNDRSNSSSSNSSSSTWERSKCHVLESLCPRYFLAIYKYSLFDCHTNICNNMEMEKSSGWFHIIL